MYRVRGQLPNLIGDDILNIFCDASIKTFPDGITIGCPGSIAFLGYEVVDWGYLILPSTTNNNSEITAIRLALEMALKHRSKYKTINIFSDSKICVYGVKYWFEGWFANIDDNGVLYSTSGVPVANQEIFKEIMKLIIVTKLQVNLYHQKGHVVETDKSLVFARHVFEESNRITLSMDQLKYISAGNDKVDKDTKYQLDLIISSLGYETPLIHPFDYQFTGDELDEYADLMKGTPL